MKLTLEVYNQLKQKVTFFYKKLQFSKYEKTKGRKLAISLVDTITLALYKQTSTRKTKKSLWSDLRRYLKCSYKTLVVNLNKCILLALVVTLKIRALNRSDAHLVKHTDATDIPVCLNKNAKHHKTTYGLASWGYSGKGFYYGLKLHLTTDLKRHILSFSLTSASGSDRSQFLNLNKDLEGIFIADAGYTSEKLEKEFYQEHKRILFAKPKKTMRKLMTAFQQKLYDTRMQIELNFRNLKLFFGLETSLPRSIDGYLGNYVYALLAYMLR